MPLSIDAKLLKKAYGDAVGPLGTPMHSAAAKELEALLMGLPKECREMGLIRICPEVKELKFADGEHADISFVTTNSVDRDREVILPGGGDWKQFKKNPIVTFAHEYACLPVGKCLWVQREQKGQLDGWLAKTQYKSRPADHPANAEWFPDSVWSFVREGFMPGKSIGFIAMNFRAAEEKEIVATPAWAKARGVIDKWLALEYAVTPVQSNPDALVTQVAKMRKKGITVDELLDRAGLIVPDDLSGIDTDEPSEPQIKFAVVPPRDIAAEFKSAAAMRVKGIDPKALVRRELERAAGRV